MLTADDKDEIRRLVGEALAERQDSPLSDSAPGNGEELHHFTGELRDLVFNEGFTELTFMNPQTGEKRALNVSGRHEALVSVTARAIEVFGTRERAVRWLKTPVRALGNQTPMSLLQSPGGLARVQETVGQVEHGVW